MQQGSITTRKMPSLSLSAKDEMCLRAAIAESEIAAQEGCMPFGGVVADSSGTILVRARNQCRAAKQRGGGLGDATRHAEMELVRAFTSQVPPDVRYSCTLYSSTMPCVMCAGAIYWSGVGRVVYGCSATQLEALSGPGGFDVDLAALYGLASKGARSIQVEGPCLADEALQVHDASGVWKHKLNETNNGSSGTNGSSNGLDAVVATPVTSQADEDIAMERSLKDTGLGSAEVVHDGIVPIIDLSIGTDDELRQQLWDAASQVGFFTVIGHGIDAHLIAQAFDTATDYFAQPVAVKALQSPLDMSLNCGFEHFAQVRPSTGVADQKESLQVTAREGCMDGRWPSQPFRDTTDALLEAAHALASRLLNLLEPLATPNNAPGTLAQSHTLWAPDGQCTLRYLHYPPMESESTEKLLADGYWRAGPHTDWTNVTLLFQQLGGKGLECCANPRTGNPAEMYWTAVDPVEGGIAVNIGDMLARWSDGKLHSNLHRVRLPRDASKARYSIAFFAQSDKNTIIECSTKDPISAGDYILSRIRSNFAKEVDAIEDASP